MTTDLQISQTNNNGLMHRLVLVPVMALALAGLTLTGCSTTNNMSTLEDARSADSLVLREGDVVKISFPGAPNQDSTQQIRRDGKIGLQLTGEIRAAGLTPTELEKEILKQGGAQLVTKEVTVTVQASSFPVFVTGAVVRPGKVLSDHPLTALEAVMEAGGFDYTHANTTHVKVVRHEGDSVKNYTLNLKKVLDGDNKTAFYLKPSDIVYVPEKFNWF